MDNTKRHYVPIRDKYIFIVKYCRKVTIDSYEKRGRKDMRRTVKNLKRISKKLMNNNIEMDY